MGEDMIYSKKCNYGLVRVLGILGICIMHYRKLLVEDALIGRGDKIFNLVADYGSAIVPFFFMLSGYCITLKYTGCQIEDSLLIFAKKRIYTLVPAAMVSTVFMACLQWVYYFLHNKQWWTGREGNLYNVLGNMLGLQSAIPKQFMDTVNGPTWYIYSLLVCYGVFWVVYWFFNNSGVNWSLLWIILFILSLGGMIYNVEYVIMNTTNFRGMFGFSLGCILAYETLDFNKKIYIEKILIGLTIIVLSLCFFSKMRIIGNIEVVLCFSLYPLVISSINRIPVMICGGDKFSF